MILRLHMGKKITGGITVILLLLLVWQYELVAYGLGQAKGQIKIIWNARPIKEILEDSYVADSLKQKIKLTQEIRDFAIDSLGVNDSDSYKSVYDQKGKPVLWVVTACEPFSLEDKKWNFPVLGSVSYKGFFEYEKALQEKAIWDAQGYDTGVRTVSAWSTLGILDDPIMSELLFRSEGELANTIVHELTHATLFVKNDLKFNENLASFIGSEGARAFLQYKYGKNSTAYQQYIYYQHDHKLFAEHMLKGVQRLDSLYKSFSPDMSREKKQLLKENKIRSILSEAKVLNFKQERYRNLSEKLLQRDSLPNNTFFKGYVRYQSTVSSLEKEYNEQFKGDIKAYLLYLKQKYGT
ncbi:aminopeptidase [Catalinimonas niigatensis]|uniref:aminopeptidase n=1 Tax=Catalinimonas niigatensis TaxID=1397264 RepID=UPI002666F746|nr:aminopeptidase [Catalinimonas niigatensis]WPP48900.1 aminopeptidase [Catalinimonas niigatensis]